MSGYTLMRKCREDKHAECPGAEVPEVTDPEFCGGRVCSCTCHGWQAPD